MPFLHADFKHLLSNSFPLFCLLFAIIYFFKRTALTILLLLYFFTGLLTWIIAKEGIHIGASGIVYAMAFFITTISIIKKEVHLMAYTLIIVFLYGSIVWGFFPTLFPDRQISWQGHLAGALTGIIIAFPFRRKGMNRKVYFEEEEEEDCGIFYS
jgi:membrane associated rhomboid family serine protease